jgi:tetratricopeptide (TPR) repeat protein
LRRTSVRLLHVNVALWALIALLVWTYRPQIEWASRALPKLLAGEFEMQREVLLYYEAERLLIEQQDAPGARAALRRSIDIDPHSESVFFLGETYMMEGALAPALEAYRRYNGIDPSHLPTWLRMAEVLALQGRDDERRDVLRDGVDYFSRHVEQYRPQHDADVPGECNDKADAVYEHYRRALETLRGKL